MKKYLILLLLAIASVTKVFASGGSSTFTNNESCPVVLTVWNDNGSCTKGTVRLAATVVAPGHSVAFSWTTTNFIATCCWAVQGCTSICAQVGSSGSLPSCPQNADLASCNVCTSAQFTWNPLLFVLTVG
ncbi:MAG TPA: hypothetical protein VN721_08310 [Flavipsychrobacter sp.]|nr:hypothetical protein [Flavipsychrobacter sp.]